MSSRLAKQYLVDYQRKVAPIFDVWVNNARKDAKHVGDVPLDAVERFLLFTQKGKHVRGAFMVLGYLIAGGEEQEEIFTASLSIEFLHTGFLIHDDIMDQDELRRGGKTLHAQFRDNTKVRNAPHYGASMAICAGDLGFAFAWKTLSEISISPERTLKACALLSECAVMTGYGQMLDISATDDLDEKQILSILKYKTAYYSGVYPFLLGATLARHLTEDEKNIINEYGLALGWVFQITDDILGMFGSEEKIGKPIGSDLREGKHTLLMLHLSQHGNLTQKNFQQELLGNPNIGQKEIKEMQQVLLEAGSYDYVINLAKKYVSEGKVVIPKLTHDKHLQSILSSFLDFMIERIA